MKLALIISAIKHHPYYAIAKAQLDEALGGKSVEESLAELQKGEGK